MSGPHLFHRVDDVFLDEGRLLLLGSGLLGGVCCGRHSVEWKTESGLMEFLGRRRARVVWVVIGGDESSTGGRTSESCRKVSATSGGGHVPRIPPFPFLAFPFLRVQKGGGKGSRTQERNNRQPGWTQRRGYPFSGRGDYMYPSVLVRGGNKVPRGRTAASRVCGSLVFLRVPLFLGVASVLRAKLASWCL